ncbi:MAG: hypothetical protein O3B43_06750, partial [Chloroflexi bacterium]|nr:hypothetical protein [Chloroflexota bacterium]
PAITTRLSRWVRRQQGRVRQTLTIILSLVPLNAACRRLLKQRDPWCTANRSIGPVGARQNSELIRKYTI